ncbi:MlaD family protein [Nocardia sp. NPDC003482]
MPHYGMPGVTVGRGRARSTGLAAVLVAALVAGGIAGYQALRPPDGLRITLRAKQVGDGIVAGARVRMDGVPVGDVVAIEPAAAGSQRITLRLDGSRLHGLDDSLRVQYAPGNLFGVSEIELHRGPGGTPLRAGTVVDLTARPADVDDATMGSLLRGLSQVGDRVFTPELAGVIARFGSDLRSFTPLLESMVVLARIVLDTQREELSLVVGRFGEALTGGADLIGAIIKVLYSLDTNTALRTERDKVDTGIAMVVHQLFPTLETTLNHAGTSFAGFTDLVVPFLTVLAQMVPTPQRSGAEVGEIIRRLRNAMPDTPDGPVLNLDLDLSGVPAVAVPLGLPGGPR